MRQEGGIVATGPTVLMVTGEYPPGLGGVGDYAALLSAHLARAGAEVAVLTRGIQDHRAPSLDSNQVPVFRSAQGWGYASWPLIASVARARGAQIVHIQYQAAAYAMHPASNLLPGYLRLRLPSVEIVTTFHDLRVPYLFPKAGALRRAAVRALDRLSHATVLTNQADLDGMREPGRVGASRPDRRWLIPIGSNISCAPPADFDRGRWRRQIGADEDTPVVSYFGFMNDTKGVEYLVQALGLLAGRGRRLRLLIVGGEAGETDPTNRSYSQQIVRLIKSRRLEDRVYWTGFVSGEQVSAALLSSDVCALPFRDGVSARRGSLLAALVHGLPVVTTCPEHPEPLLVDGDNVVMVERDSPSALADAIELLWLSPELRDRLSAGARALARRFEWPDIAVRHLEMYETLLGHKR
ncbi:MAG: glycosyltransferase family 4 protein [Chloroflexota bacterium]